MNNKLNKVKLKGNESFNIREGWLRKGMRCVAEDPRLFAKREAMELLGMGSKMVKSVRFWLQATGLTQEVYQNGGRVQTITEDFGRVIDRYDPYFDDIFTLWLLHANIVANEEFCIAWNIFFNEYEGENFTREDLFLMCKAQLVKRMEEGAAFSEKSFYSDCASILKMYLSAETSEDPEESLGCPFAALGLIRRNANSKNAYRKVAPSPDQLDKLAVLYVIRKNLAEGKRSVSIDDLLGAPNNVGKVFHLNRVGLNEYLDQLRVSGLLTLTRTAGLDMAYLEDSPTPPEIMTAYYEKATVR